MDSLIQEYTDYTKDSLKEMEAGAKKWSQRKSQNDAPKEIEVVIFYNIFTILLLSNKIH